MADKAKDFERYEVSDRVFPVLLSLFENNEEEVQNSRIKAEVTVREDERAIEEIKSTCKITNPDHHLADGD